MGGKCTYGQTEIMHVVTFIEKTNDTVVACGEGGYRSIVVWQYRGHRSRRNGDSSNNTGDERRLPLIVTTV